MAKPKRVEITGDNIIVHMDDNTRFYGAAMPGQGWIINGGASAVPDPDPGDGGGGTPTPGDGKWQWPFQYSKYVFTSGPIAPLTQFGMRKNPVTGVYRLHAGLDFGAGGIAGMAIPAACAGTVVESAYNAGMGNHVWINHDGGFQTRYFHMVRTPDVKAGDKVTRGQKLGNVGSTGNSTGPHLHWETHTTPGTPVNPRDFMKARGVPES